MACTWTHSLTYMHIPTARVEGSQATPRVHVACEPRRVIPCTYAGYAYLYFKPSFGQSNSSWNASNTASSYDGSRYHVQVRVVQWASVSFTTYNWWEWLISSTTLFLLPSLLYCLAGIVALHCFHPWTFFFLSSPAYSPACSRPSLAPSFVPLPYPLLYVFFLVTK